MARLIDADALIEDIKSFWDWDSIDGITSTTVLKQTITDISHAPTIDAVPVVRCKDCRHWSEMQNSAGACLRHSVIAGSWWNGTDSTDFCSFAERRDDELQEDDGRREVPCAE